ncbi:MAG: hypothetical protein PHP06_06045 [Clostridia bacterium]|nr:hypothetical protein [Clostridia bacterium]
MGTVFVVTYMDSLVEINLEKSIKCRFFGIIPFPFKTKKVIINIDDKKLFIKEVNKRIRRDEEYES